MRHIWLADAVGAMRRSSVLYMRFPPLSSAAASPGSTATGETGKNDASSDEHHPTAASASTTPEPPRPAYRALPSSMYPKSVSADFTPFPLPKYSEDMGFGPVRLQNIPDVEVAKERCRKAAATSSSSTMSTRFSGAATALMDELNTSDSVVNTARLLCGAEEVEAQPGQVTPVDEEDLWSLAAQESTAAQGSTASPLRGYAVREHYPIVDVIECHRTVDDLLQQFFDRPEREARAATVLDLASSLQKRSDVELERVLYELTSLFTPNGNGLNFLASKVVKCGRPYSVSNELMKAFVYFVDALTEVFVEAQPERLTKSPSLFAQVLHFLALIKVFEPNKWFSMNPNAPQNRADYSHPSGVNLRTAHWRTGEVLFDALVEAILDARIDRSGEGEHLQGSMFLHWTPENLIDVLAGFAAVNPNNKPPSGVVRVLLGEIWHNWSLKSYLLGSEAELRQLERLYLILQMMDISRDEIVVALLGDAVPEPPSGPKAVPQLRPSPSGRPALSLDETKCPARGPDFFSAVSRDRRPAVRKAALKHLDSSLSSAASRGAGGLVERQALVEAGTELLQSLRDKEMAVMFAIRHEFDYVALQGIPPMIEVGSRLRATPIRLLPPLREETSLPNTAFILQSLTQSPPPYVMKYNGRRVHPIRTFFSALQFLHSMDNVFLLHSSGVKSHTSALVSAVQRQRSGSDALVVSMSCLRSLYVMAMYGRSEKERASAMQALEIVGGELETGRAVLVPISEELYLHDADTYCDEDIMLWTLAAFFARDLPLVKVNTIMAASSEARNPYNTLKGEHSPLTSRGDLYNSSTPLLQSLRSKELRSVTHHTALRKPVRDRQCTLFNVNPIRQRFVYRRDKALFDKYHVHSRHLAAGFSQGALASDLRGLGFYTPDHPQVPYTPLSTPLPCASQ